MHRKIYSKIYIERQGPRITKSTLKKNNKEERIILLDVKRYYIATVTRKVWF